MVHESFTDSGLIIDSTLGFATKTHLVRSQGAPLRKKPSDPVTIESVRDNWSQVVNMENAQRIEKIAEVTVDLVEKLQDFEERCKLDGQNESYWGKYKYNSKDLVCYALGVGASVVNPSDLKFLYESHESFSALPTFFILPGMLMESPVVGKAMPPGKYADFTNVREIYQNKELVIRTQQHIFVLGQGGFGGPRNSKQAIAVEAVPKRSPDAVLEQRTAEDQAALYRLSGDLNPLHIDPNVATASGHPRPILHGLASLGFSARHVLMKYAGNDASNVKALKARFAKPVLPGQTLITEMWLEGKRVHFQTKLKETGNIVIASSYMDLKNVIKDGAPASNQKMAAPSASSLKSDSLFAKIEDGIKANPDKAKSVGAVYLYNITLNGKTVKQWTLDLKSALAVYQGEPKSGKADTTMTVSDDDLMEIAAGTLSPQVAYLKGRLKISGNIMLAQKLGPLLKSEAKL
nr:peroxisomal multifunctional enzyme type 2 isoform X2 [Danaus plexippus plexippus]